MKLLTASFFVSLAAAQTEDPSTWPACDADAPTTCPDDSYLNPVACKCFVKIRCSDECVAGVSALIPTEACTCAPYADIQGLFPSWATSAIANAAELVGLTAAVPEVHDWKVCEDRGILRCTDDEKQYWNELTCNCHYISHDSCELQCPDGQGFMPQTECTCAATETVKAEYPTWATDEDKKKAYDNGIVNWTANTATAKAEAEAKAAEEAAKAKEEAD